MSKFSKRSTELELLDAPNIPQKLLFQNLSELDFINRTLGGHSITISGIKKLVVDKQKHYKVVDIGCGSGESMIYITKWAKKNGYKVSIVGVDMNVDCIEYAKKACVQFSEIATVVADYKNYLTTNTDIDIIHCSLFCHHLTDDELVELFDYMNKNTRIGFVINDLHRHWLAYYSIWFLTRLLNGSSLVKNDAPLSVWRGFSKSELTHYLVQSGVKKYFVKWKWAFRFLIVHQK
ncbi:MAG: methyltransferase domain-containing protein [Bacteroidia bacterium]|nr:methyltransferase domain-containing protein [Bacteroidia bacterium]